MFSFDIGNRSWFPTTPTSTDEPSEQSSLPSPVVSSTASSLEPAPSPCSSLLSEAPQAPLEHPSSPATLNAATQASPPSDNTSSSSPPSEVTPQESTIAFFFSEATDTPTEPTTPPPAMVTESDETEEDQLLDETIYGSLASGSSTSVSETSNSSQILTFTIDQLSLKELRDLAHKYDVARAGPKKI